MARRETKATVRPASYALPGATPRELPCPWPVNAGPVGLALTACR